MKKTILRAVTLSLACLLLLLGCVSCGGKGKTLMELKKDGISVSLSVNFYELMLSRMKGTLSSYGYTANGVTADYAAFWDFKDTFNGDKLQTIDQYYRDNILENCRTYLVALYLFEKEGLSLSASAKQEIEDRLDELVLTDGGGSKTKLNSVLSAYGVNYDILKEIYTVEAKVAALQTHLYGENGKKLGDNVKTEFLNENYVHFRQVFVATFRYLYEEDSNGDTIYFYESSNGTKDRICYDVHNGVKDERSGSAVKDKNGDEIYYVKDTDYKKIAYDSVNGVPAYIPTKDGSDYEKEYLTDKELEEKVNKAQELFDGLKTATAAEFEAVMEAESDDNAEVSEYDDGFYLQKDLDYTASGEKFMHLDDIVAALKTMQDGEVAMIKSSEGYHIIRKYPHTEHAYDKEENEAWFEGFYDNLIKKLFLEECRSHYGDIQLDNAILAASATMKEVKSNYYY